MLVDIAPHIPPYRERYIVHSIGGRDIFHPKGGGIYSITKGEGYSPPNSGEKYYPKVLGNIHPQRVEIYPITKESRDIPAITGRDIFTPLPSPPQPYLHPIATFTISYHHN